MNTDGILGGLAFVVAIISAFFTARAASQANTISDKEADTNIAKVAMEIMAPLREEVGILRKQVTTLRKRITFLERFIKRQGLTVPEYDSLQ